MTAGRYHCRSIYSTTTLAACTRGIACCARSPHTSPALSTASASAAPTTRMRYRAPRCRHRRHVLATGARVPHSLLLFVVSASRLRPASRRENSSSSSSAMRRDIHSARVPLIYASRTLARGAACVLCGMEVAGPVTQGGGACGKGVWRRWEGARQ